MILVRVTTVSVSLKLLLTGQPEHFRQQGLRVLTASGPGPEMEGEADLHTLPLSRELAPVADLRALWVTWRWLRQVKPRIVHTHTPKAGLIGMLAAWLARVPVRLHTVAGLPEMEATGLLKQILRLTERITAACASHVYANSVGLARYLEEEDLVPARKLSVIGAGSSNGIDTTRFQPTDDLREAARQLRSRHGVGATGQLLVFVGRLDDHKGLRELQAAFSTLGNEYPDLQLWLVGPIETARGGLDQGTLDVFQGHPRVLLPGFQPDVRPWLLAADILVFPSYCSNPPIWFWIPQAASEETLPKKTVRLLDHYLPISSLFQSNEVVLHDQRGRQTVDGRPPEVDNPMNIRPQSTVNDPSSAVHGPRSTVFPLPASRFFRPYLPKIDGYGGQALKLRRILTEMTAAAREGVDYHLWWHPHNLATHPERNLKALDTILSHFRHLHREYAMESAHMGDLVEP